MLESFGLLSMPFLKRGYCKGKSRKVKGKSEEEKRIFHSHSCLNLPRSLAFLGATHTRAGCELRLESFGALSGASRRLSIGGPSRRVTSLMTDKRAGFAKDARADRQSFTSNESVRTAAGRQRAAACLARALARAAKAASLAEAARAPAAKGLAQPGHPARLAEDHCRPVAAMAHPAAAGLYSDYDS